MGGDLKGTTLQSHKSYYAPLEELCNTTSLTHIGDPPHPNIHPHKLPTRPLPLTPPSHGTISAHIYYHHNL